MFDLPELKKETKASLYEGLLAQAKSIVADEHNALANQANIVALLFHSLPDVSWLGFYFLEPETKQLVLGPFQGKLACTRIPLGRGVCGKVAVDKAPLIVGDVNAFSDHIACDITTQSECVLPMFSDEDNKQLFGVLDVDSQALNRFDEEDVQGLMAIVELLK